MLRVVNKHGAFSLYIKLCYKAWIFDRNTCRLPDYRKVRTFVLCFS